MAKVDMDKNYSMKTIHRTITILRAFSIKKNKLTMTELNELTGISIPSLQRILATLVYEGFLQRDEETKKYQLGIELYFLGRLVEKDSSLLNTARPVMERIRDFTGESVTLNAIHQNMRRCIGYCQSHHELTTLTYVGHDSPLYAGASAKLLLAHLGDEEIKNYLDNTKFELINEEPAVFKEKLLKEIENIRKKGFAISSGERVKGAFSISAPIFNPFGDVTAGLSIVIPQPRVDEFNIDDLITTLKEAAQEITNLLASKN